MGRRLRLALVLLITAGCLALAFRGIEFDRVQDALGSMRWSLVPLVIALMTVQLLLRVWRFQVVLGEVRPSFGRQFVVGVIGYMAINVIPLRMGEFVRPWMLTRDKIPLGHSLASVAVERVLDMLVLLGLLLFVATALELPTDVIVIEGIDVLAASRRAIAVMLGLILVGVVVLAFGSKTLASLLAKVPVLGSKLVAFGEAFRAAAAGLVARPLDGLLALGLTAVVWWLTIAGAYVLLGAFEGVPQTWTVATAAGVITIAGAAVIPTPGFFGPFEVVCKAVLVLWAVDPGVAATFAIIWHLHIFLFNLLPGLVFMVREGLGFSSLVGQSQSLRESAPAQDDSSGDD